MRFRPWGYWTRARAAAALKRLAGSLGRTPTARDIYKVARWDCPSARTFCDIFGTIIKAQRAAGLKPVPRGTQRWTHCRAGHPLTPDNLYQWPRRVQLANGRWKVCVFRRCKKCHRADSVRDRRRKRAQRAQSPATKPSNIKKFYRPAERVVRADIAERHSPAALAAYWRMAS